MEQVTNKVITDPFGDKGRFTGVLIRGKPDSHGTMLYADGRVYSGCWRRGRWDGHGNTMFVNGDSYTGDYENDQRQGIGRYEWHDARVYDGRFERNQRQGNGIYSWPDGSVYSGEFHQGLRHGLGVFTYQDGSVYTGQWRNGKQHGNGECVWADGRCFRGEWVDGHTRFGVEVRADGSIRHCGEWRNDRPLRKKKTIKRSADHSIKNRESAARSLDLLARLSNDETASVKVAIVDPEQPIPAKVAKDTNPSCWPPSFMQQDPATADSDNSNENAKPKPGVVANVVNNTSYCPILPPTATVKAASGTINSSSIGEVREKPQQTARYANETMPQKFTADDAVLEALYRAEAPYIDERPESDSEVQRDSSMEEPEYLRNVVTLSRMKGRSKRYQVKTRNAAYR